MHANLIDLRSRTPEERQAIARAGGSARSDRKTIANMTKNVKTGKYAKSLTQTVEDLVRNPEQGALRIYAIIDHLDQTSDQLTPKLQMDLARLHCEAFKTVHGSRQVNVNLNTDLREDLERWFDEKH